MISSKIAIIDTKIAIITTHFSLIVFHSRDELINSTQLIQFTTNLSIS